MSKDNVTPLFEPVDPRETLVSEIFEAIDRQIDKGIDTFDIVAVLELVKYEFLAAQSEDDE